jgi:hypothetical protein
LIGQSRAQTKKSRQKLNDSVGLSAQAPFAYQKPSTQRFWFVNIKARRGERKAMLLVCWFVLSGMGVTDAPNDNATYHCSDSTLLNHPYLVSIVSQHAWNSFQAAIS